MPALACFTTVLFGLRTWQRRTKPKFIWGLFLATIGAGLGFIHTHTHTHGAAAVAVAPDELKVGAVISDQDRLLDPLLYVSMLFWPWRSRRRSFVHFLYRLYLVHSNSVYAPFVFAFARILKNDDGLSMMQWSVSIPVSWAWRNRWHGEKKVKCRHFLRRKGSDRIGSHRRDFILTCRKWVPYRHLMKYLWWV